jgi:cytochrome c biogenesis factor
MGFFLRFNFIKFRNVCNKEKAMLSLLILLLQVVIPLLIGLLISYYLRDVVYRLLIDLCGTEDRAEFWLRTSAVLTIGAPLMLVLLFGHSIDAQSCSKTIECVDVIQRTLALSLGGVLLAVGFVSRVIWKQALGSAQSRRSVAVDG